MKQIHKTMVLPIIVIFIISIIAIVYSFIHYSRDKDFQIINVDNTMQMFPIKLDNTFEIISASIEDNLLVISLKNRKTSEVYLSSLSYDDLEDFVCNVQYYEYKGRNINYNCSTRENTVHSMIKEVGLQAIDMIREDD